MGEMKQSGDVNRQLSAFPSSEKNKGKSYSCAWPHVFIHANLRDVLLPLSVNIMLSYITETATSQL